MLEQDKLLITPLAYIRGRTLQKAYFIVDEAQNLTPHEVKTVITRAGEGTKIISQWEKGDKTKHNQLYLYKQYYSELFKVPLNKINIEFYIVKRKVLDFDDENLKSPHQAYRVQNFKPVDNKKRLKDANKDFVSFIKECYTDTGNPIDKEFEKKIDKPCDWCDFGKNKDLCGASLTPDEKFFSF